MSSTSTLTALPPELVLEIADYFLEDYVMWKVQLPWLRKKTFHLDLCPYVNIARTHRSLWEVLMARRFAKGVLSDAAACKIIATAKKPNVEGCSTARTRTRMMRRRRRGDRERRNREDEDNEEEGEVERRPNGMERCEVLKE